MIRYDDIIDSMPRHFFNFMYPIEANKIHDEYASFIPNVYKSIKNLFVFTPKVISNKTDKDISN